MIPLAGGVIGGAFDMASTSVIAKNAIKLFIKGEEPTGEAVTEAEAIEIESMVEEAAEQEKDEKG